MIEQAGDGSGALEGHSDDFAEDLDVDDSVKDERNHESFSIRIAVGCFIGGRGALCSMRLDNVEGGDDGCDGDGGRGGGGQEPEKDCRLSACRGRSKLERLLHKSRERTPETRINELHEGSGCVLQKN
mmetsp:Transcript_5949/g.7718  ORF Transcript_5949/g.7718 Transcript_5949/m.7718 type:complete len:128 (-) Transcript_5949:475-858(-)